MREQQRRSRRQEDIRESLPCSINPNDQREEKEATGSNDEGPAEGIEDKPQIFPLPTTEPKSGQKEEEEEEC